MFIARSVFYMFLFLLDAVLNATITGPGASFR